MTSAAARQGNRVRMAVWALHMALPLLALWLLLAQPDLDVTWQHQPSHFWLVAVVAAVNVGLALRVLAAARPREDARLLLAGYAFLLAAGFLGLHALATPGVLLDSPDHMPRLSSLRPRSTSARSAPTPWCATTGR